MRKNRTSTFIVLLFLFVGARRCLAQTVSMQYENGFLSADIQSATIKEIFEELRKQAGFTYEIEKEIQEQKVTISFKDKELVQGIKDILNTVGNPSYMISYKGEVASGEWIVESKEKMVDGKKYGQRTTTYEISNITIRKRGSSEAGTGEKRELREGEMEVGLVTDDPKWNTEFKNLKKYSIRAKDVDLNELLERLSNIVGVKILAVKIDKKIDFEGEDDFFILMRHFFDRIRPKIYDIKTHSAEVDRKGNVIKQGYYEVTQLSATEIRQRREQAELKNAEGERLMKQGRYLEALDAFGSVPDPDDIKADINMGKIYLLNREYFRAIGHFNTALDIDSTNTDAYLGLIDAYEKDGQIDKVLENMEKYVLYSRDEKEVKGIKRRIDLLKEESNVKYYSFIKKGDEYKSKGDVGKAREAYEGAINVGTELVTGYKKMAIICRDTKDYERAEEMYKKAIEIEKDNFEFYSNLAELYMEMGENKKAIEFFNKFYEVYPDKNPVIKMKVEETIKALKGK